MGERGRISGGRVVEREGKWGVSGVGWEGKWGRVVGREGGRERGW